MVWLPLLFDLSRHGVGCASAPVTPFEKSGAKEAIFKAHLQHDVHASYAGLNTDSLETFVEVARLGSFAAAARASDSNPSLVSRTIAGLERELGLRLFQRSTRRMAPTEAGAELENRN